MSCDECKKKAEIIKRLRTKLWRAKESAKRKVQAARRYKEQTS